MFERNIVDLVELFIENVQSLYPFLGDPPGEVLWAQGALLAWPVSPASSRLGEAPARVTKGPEGSAPAPAKQDAPSWWPRWGVEPASAPDVLAETATNRHFITRPRFLPEVPVPRLIYGRSISVPRGD